MKRKRDREPKPIHPTLASAAGTSLIKHLASCNTTIRSQSVKLIQTWLASQPQQLSESEMKKLWKGLFYCFWHCDKVPNQLALTDRLISMFLSLEDSLSLEFFRGFLITLRREWPGIDRLRLDKFYLLIRRFMRAVFVLMRSRNWDVEVVTKYFGVLENDGFLAEDKLMGNGVNYHVSSVFWEELNVVGFPLRKDVVDTILGPFFEVLKRGKDRVLVGKVKSCVFDELVKAGKMTLEKKKEGTDMGEDGSVLTGVVALKMELSGKLYDVGSSVNCIQGNRKVALGLHEEFRKLENELESSGVEITLSEYDGLLGADNDDEIPQLIPINYDGNKNAMQSSSEEGSNIALENQVVPEERRLKKSKKAKKGHSGDGEKDKKKKKKKKKKIRDANGVSVTSSLIKENGDSVSVNGMDGHNEDKEVDDSAVSLNETVISNLQKQFEKVAAEAYDDEDSDDFCTPLPSVNLDVQVNKRRRTVGAGNNNFNGSKTNGVTNAVVDSAENSVGKSAKKVRFDMKNNLVWKPQNPLPPESLRLPPSATPRGSALKKGVPPGPVIEMPSSKRKNKQKKKVQKRLMSATPVIKRRKKAQTGSA